MDRPAQTASRGSRKLISFLSFPWGLRRSWLGATPTTVHRIPVYIQPNLILKLHLKKV